jgi:RNA polymerase sigma-70 factor, ECF subfamily
MPSASAHLDDGLVTALRKGEEDAFAELLDSYSSALLRVASTYVRSRAVAEEVVQETWIAVIRGIDRFEGRSSLRTWIFRICANVAARHGGRERFDPEERLVTGETRAVLASAIEALPPAQRRVISLRDVEGWSAAETCDALGLSESNQRVLLHRARAKVCAALERHGADL